MMSHEPIQLTRDCEATVIPAGYTITVPAGAMVQITQRLGGNFTVSYDGGLVRIPNHEADALGLEPESTVEPDSNKTEHTGPPSEEAIWDQLKTVYDPEIPVNVVDLGLIYSCQIEARDSGTFDVEIKMTLTAPGCGMGPAIAQDAKYKVEQVPGVSEAQVDIVWDPPWHQEMISEEGKMQLGLI